MRVLFTTFPAIGHLHPLVPLAKAFVRRGDDVRVATGENLLGWVRRCGLNAVAAGLSEKDALAAARASAPRGAPIGPHMFARVAPEPMLQDLDAFAQTWRPDLVLHEEAEYAGPALAAALEVPCATHSWHAPCRPESVRRDAVGAIRPLWPPARRSDASVTGDVYLDACPGPLQSAAIASIPGVMQIRPIPYDGPAVDVPKWLPSLPEPAAYVTLGTVAASARPDLLRMIIDAVRHEVAATVVTTGPNEVVALGSLPADVYAAPYLPQHQVLPKVNVVVSHGGAGTTLGALHWGLPHLVLPQHAPSQQMCAERVAAIGAGTRLIEEEQTPQRIGEEIRHLLGDEAIRRMASALASTFASAPGPDEVAARLADG